MLAAIPVARPLLPPAEAIQPYLREIDANAWYSNHGPLARRLQGRLATHWGMPDQSVALLANATCGLTLALLASGVKPGQRCFLPSWTFVASAGAVASAGMIPHFVDVSPSTWAPNPDEIERLARLPDAGAILVVSPFGAPLDLAMWDRVRRRTGLPVIIDAAAAFDTLRADGPMPAGDCPIVVSLHATKVFGIGEGGALMSRDPDFVSRVRALAQFGFAGTREAKWPGGNAKLSEYGAAVGLAGLDVWPETRTRWDRATQTYRQALPRSVALPPRFGLGWVSSTLTVLAPRDQPGLDDQLAASGVATLRWWGGGCHTQQAYGTCPSEDLPVTAVYARRAVGLPFWQGLTAPQIDTVATALRRALVPAARRRADAKLVEA